MLFEGFIDRSRAFKAYYNNDTAIFSTAEARIKRLYEWHLLGIKPWEWDIERYGGENEDMRGYFYLEDLENIKQLDKLEKEFKRRQQQ